MEKNGVQPKGGVKDNYRVEYIETFQPVEELT